MYLIKKSWMLIICLGTFPLALPGQNLQWILEKNGAHFELQVLEVKGNGLFSGEMLKVYVGEREALPDTSELSIVGQVVESGKGLRFKPVFPFRAGMVYTAFLGREVRNVFKIPHSGTSAELTAIYPSGAILPANLLKIYLHFSAPMGEGRAYQHLTLTDESGKTVHQPFVPLQPELWSEDRRRLTLWLDPGRVKRGLLSHEAHGVVLENGREYILKIHPEWKDADGNPLGKAYQKKFKVVASDYFQPSIDNWKILEPKGGGTEALVIEFGESLDQALAIRHIRVQNNKGVFLTGKVELREGESRWKFFPDRPWTAGSYTIVIDTDLEDLAGNNLNRPFDRDLKRDNAAPETFQDYQFINFEIKPSE